MVVKSKFGPRLISARLLEFVRRLYKLVELRALQFPMGLWILTPITHDQAIPYRSGIPRIHNLKRERSAA